MKPVRVTAEQARWLRWRRSGLVTPFADPLAVTGALVGVQAQLLPAAGLALWHRSHSFDHADLDAGLHEHRTLVKVWTLRSTLHLHRVTDWPLVCAATYVPGETYYERQVVRRGGDLAAFHRALDEVAAVLREQGPVTRSDLAASGLALSPELSTSWGGAFSELVHRGLVCHAGQRGAEAVFAWRAQWLPDLQWAPPPFDEANQELARRYFAGYGPAREIDFRYWRQARAPQSRRWLAAILGELAPIELLGEDHWVRREDVRYLAEPPPAPEAWPVRLLYRFDPLLLGLREKWWLVDPDRYKAVWRPGGHIEATITVAGRIAGTWRYDRVSAGLRVTLAPFAPLPAFARQAVEKQALGVAAFFALPLADLEG